jgi:thiosulfate dehydrogenase
MPFDKVSVGKPYLTDAQALDIAAYVNNDSVHSRPNPKTMDCPDPKAKAIDYAHAPFSDPFSEKQHKLGPYKPIIEYWKKQGWKANLLKFYKKNLLLFYISF